MKIRPQKYHPLLDVFHSQDKTNTFSQYIASTLNEDIKNIHDTVLKMPNHHAYIQAHCQAR